MTFFLPRSDSIFQAPTNPPPIDVLPPHDRHLEVAIDAPASAEALPGHSHHHDIPATIPTPTNAGALAAGDLPSRTGRPPLHDHGVSIVTTRCPPCSPPPLAHAATSLSAAYMRSSLGALAASQRHCLQDLYPQDAGAADRREAR
jgi:hypothetical protein